MATTMLQQEIMLLNIFICFDHRSLLFSFHEKLQFLHIHFPFTHSLLTHQYELQFNYNFVNLSKLIGRLVSTKIVCVILFIEVDCPFPKAIYVLPTAHIYLGSCFVTTRMYVCFVHSTSPVSGICRRIAPYCAIWCNIVFDYKLLSNYRRLRS